MTLAVSEAKGGADRRRGATEAPAGCAIAALRGTGPVDPFSTSPEELAAPLDERPGWRPLYLAPLPDETRRDLDDICLLGIKGQYPTSAVGASTVASFPS